MGAAGNSKHVQLQRHLHHRQLIHGKKQPEPSKEPTHDEEQTLPEEHLPRSTSDQRRLLKMQLRQMLSSPTIVGTASEDEQGHKSGMDPEADANSHDNHLDSLRLLASTLAADVTESAATYLTFAASSAK